MAIMETPASKALVLTIHEGMDEKGKEINKKHTFRNLTLDASASGLYSAAEALATLYAGSLRFVHVVDTDELSK